MITISKAGGHRTRSNSTFQVPNWLRKKRSSSGRPSRSSEQERRQSSPHSIEQLFEMFKQTASIQTDPLAKYIVSRNTLLQHKVGVYFTYELFSVVKSGQLL